MSKPVELDELVNAIDEVVSLPMITQEVISHTYNKKANAHSLSRIISRDPVLSAKILRVANSSFFGFFFKTNDIKSAVVRLGVKQVRNIAVSLGVGLFYKGPKGLAGYSRVNVWEHSIAVGIMSEIIAKHCASHEAKAIAGEALLAGLLHDIGIILIEQQLSSKFNHIIAYASGRKIPLYNVEIQALGYNHTDLASKILRKWRLPPKVVDAVASHHNQPDRKQDVIVSLTQMAEIMGSATKVGYCDIHTIAKDRFMFLQSQLGLVGKSFMDVKNIFDKKIGEALKIFDVSEESLEGESQENKEKDTRTSKRKTADPSSSRKSGRSTKTNRSSRRRSK